MGIYLPLRKGRCIDSVLVSITSTASTQILESEIPSSSIRARHSLVRNLRILKELKELKSKSQSEFLIELIILRNAESN